MPLLQLLASGPGTGKTSFCIDLFKKSVQKTKNGIASRCFFVLPSREHADRIQNLILKKEIKGLFNTHILTINDFSSRLLGVTAHRHPTDAIRLGIIQGILENGTAFEYFKNPQEFEGLAELILDTIKEFKSALLSVNEFEKASQPLLGKAYFKQKFRDFSIVLKQYEKKLDEMGLTEPEDESELLFKSKQAPAVADLVIFDGFYHFTKAQERLIEAVSTKAHTVLVTLTLGDAKSREPLFQYPLQTRKNLLALGFKEKKSALSKNLRTEEKDLLHLEQQLFCEQPVVAAIESGSIKIFEAANKRQELEMIARQIKQLYREESMHYSDICVIFRKLSGSESSLQAVFDRYDIPYFLHERKKLIEHGSAQILYRFLKLLSDEWKREDLLFVMKSSYFMKDRGPQAVLALEKFAWSNNIKGGREKWTAILKNKEIEDSSKTLLRGVLDLAAGFAEAKNLAIFKRKVLSLFEELLQAEARDAEMLAIDQKASEALAQILDSAAYWEEDQKDFEPIAFMKQMQKSMEKGLYSYKPSGKNRVQVYDVVMAMPKEFKAVFMAGLVEKVFPQVILENPIFKDHERRLLNKKSLILEERRNRRSGEKYFFYMGVARAKQKLYLSYPSYDTDGKALLTSFFVEEVKKCFKAIPVSKKSLQDLVALPEEWETEQEVSLGLSQIVFHRPEQKDSLGTIFTQWLHKDGFKEALRAGLWDERAKISDLRIRSLLQSESSRFSATKLETFATCAFKYFSERVLNLQKPFEDTRFLEMGRILHTVLEDYYKTKVSLTKLMALLEAELEKSAFSSEPLYRKRIYFNQMKKTLSTFVQSETELADKRDYAPKYFELAFKEKFSLGKNEPSVTLEGKIDRVDISGDGERALVVDYKLSKRPQTLEKKLGKGLEIQLPLYALMVKRLLGVSLAGVELKFLQSQGRDGIYLESARGGLGLSAQKKTYSDEAFAEILKHTEIKINEHIHAIREADISVRSKSCDYCSYNPVCRFEKWKLAYEKVL